MIKQLDIINFQSHKDSSLQFAPGVNVIVGATDSGKTAILRALRWLIWNRPSGDSFRSTWGGHTRATVELDDHHITRHKGDVNSYLLDDQTFKAFGNDVPEPIKDLLNIDDINLQMQLDAPFLISASAGETASYFNRIAHLDQIDIGLKNLQGWLRKLSIRHEEDTERIQELQQAHKRYDYIPKFEARLEVLESMQGEKNHIGAQFQKLTSALNELADVEYELVRIREVTAHKNQVFKILSLIKEKESLQKQLNTLEEYIRQHKHVREMIHLYKQRAKPLDKAVQILTLMDQRDILQKDADSLETKLDRLKDVTDKWKMKIDLAKAGQKTFDASMPDICPLCETDLTTRNIHER